MLCGMKRENMASIIMFSLNIMSFVTLFLDHCKVHLPKHIFIGDRAHRQCTTVNCVHHVGCHATPMGLNVHILKFRKEKENQNLECCSV